MVSLTQTLSTTPPSSSTPSSVTTPSAAPSSKRVPAASLNPPLSLDCPYLDPYTAMPDGYRARSRWRSIAHKISKTIAGRHPFATIDALEGTGPAGVDGRRIEPVETMVVRLTQRNLTEFFNPEYTDEVDEVRVRVHPHTKKKSVDKWIEGLPVQTLPELDLRES